jgi:hypothetical protein
MKNMSSNGLVSKNMYYELGLIIAAASKRGIQLDKPKDFDHNVDQELLMALESRKWTIRKNK